MTLVEFVVGYGEMTWTLDVEFDQSVELFEDVQDEMSEGWFEEVGKYIRDFDYDLYSFSWNVLEGKLV
jgi:hypothetical protein